MTLDDFEAHAEPGTFEQALQSVEVGDVDAARRVLMPLIGPGGEPEIKAAVAKWVAELLQSGQPKLQALGLDLLVEMDVEFPFAALIDLLDASNGIGARALDLLRDGTGHDFERDKGAWRAYFDRRGS